MCHQELELSLQHEVTQHQRELSGLQTVQNERINSLAQRHQDEVDQLQSKINELERVSDRGSVMATGGSEEREGEDGELRGRCDQLEAQVKRLTRKIGELEGVSRSGEEQVQRLTGENLRLTHVKGQLESQLKAEQVYKYHQMYVNTTILGRVCTNVCKYRTNQYLIQNPVIKTEHQSNILKHFLSIH